MGDEALSGLGQAAACELLEASIKLCIGRNITSADAEGGDFSKLYEHLFPAMLRLATDADGFARRLLMCGASYSRLYVPVLTLAAANPAAFRTIGFTIVSWAAQYAVGVPLVGFSSPSADR